MLMKLTLNYLHWAPDTVELMYTSVRSGLLPSRGSMQWDTQRLEAPCFCDTSSWKTNRSHAFQLCLGSMETCNHLGMLTSAKGMLRCWCHMPHGLPASIFSKDQLLGNSASPPLTPQPFTERLLHAKKPDCYNKSLKPSKHRCWKWSALELWFNT